VRLEDVVYKDASTRSQIDEILILIGVIHAGVVTMIA